MENETAEKIVLERQEETNYYSEVFILEEDLKKESAIYQLLD